MRENLFRGKKYRKSVFDQTDWVYGSLIDSGNHEQVAIYPWIDGASTMSVRQLVYARMEGVKPETVGKYIGPDKNGKKIFEGDIGRYKQTDGAKRNGKPITCIGKVVYNAKTASFAVESNDETGCKHFDYFPIKDFEVIGNIHDHPELLEVNGNGNL